MVVENILRLSMDRLMGFFQGDLVVDFGFTDDQVIDSAMTCEAELKRARLHLPPPPPDASEYPTRPFGLFVPPSVEQQIGRPILETTSELLRGRRSALHRESRLSISIPPDGGPVIVESLDIPSGPSTTSGPRLPSVVSIDEDKTPPGHSDKPGIPGEETTTANPTAHERRAAFARAHTAKQVSNGITETALGFTASLSSNGKNVGAAGQPMSSVKHKLVATQKSRDLVEATDSAAPQNYGVSVRL